MRNDFICEIPESVRMCLPRHEVEGLDLLFDDLDAAEHRRDFDDMDMGNDVGVDMDRPSRYS